MKKVYIFTIVTCVLIGSTFSAEKYTGPINPEKIKAMFSSITTHNNTPYTDVTAEEVWIGSFTDFGNNDFVMKVVGDFSQADGFVHYWLLRKNGETLTPTMELGVGDNGSVKFVDVNGDGKEEILVITSSGSQGEMSEKGNLYSFSSGKPKILYSYSDSSNYSMFSEEEPESCEHDIQFKDIDNDGKLELIDTKISSGQKVIYRLIDGVYKL